MRIDESGITEPSRRLPLAGEYDVAVVGGGIAGTAAAVAAARQGLSVCLIEKENGLGGLATLGNVTVWLPICDGMGRQVIGGIGEELLRLSVQDLGRDQRDPRFLGIPDCWQPGGDPEPRRKTRFRVNFNPAAYMLALESWVLEAGVELFYDTRLCAVRRSQDRLTHLLIENKSGRLGLAARAFVDATGDADLCHFAGEATASLDSNVLCGWFYYLVEGKLHLRPYSQPYSPRLTREGSVGPFFRGDRGKQVTEMIVGSRQLMREQLAELRRRHPDSEVQIFAPPTIPCFRATRRLVGAVSPGECDVHRWFKDTVALTGDWRKCGPVYAIPLRSLRGVRNRNLLAAGRCISVDISIWDCTRAIPTCAVTGEAAGIAAALMASADQPSAELDVADLQQRIRDRDGLLEPNLVAPIS